MRKYLIIIALLAIIGGAAALYLIPGKEQIAVMQQKDETIRASAGGAPVDYQAAYDRGERTDAVVAGWAAKAISEGRGAEALPVLEAHLQQNPDHIESRKQLALLYQAAGRDEDYFREIETIVSKDPSASNLKMLADMYNYTKQYDKQAETLRKLIEMTQGTDPEVYVDLATIQLLQDDKTGADATLQDLRQRHPSYTSFKLTRLTVISLVDSGASDKAHAEASAWVNQSQNAKEIADLTNIINYGGRPDLALDLVNIHRDIITQDIDLFTAYINASMNGGKRDQAYAVLQRVYEEGKLPATLYRPYIELALERGETDRALAVAQKIDNRYFSQDDAINLVELARAGGAEDVTNALVAAFDKPDYLTDKPALDAIIAMMARKSDEDTKIKTALDAQLNSNQRLRLAQACARNNKTACFNNVVSRFPKFADMNPRELDEVVMLYISVDRQKDILTDVTDVARASNSEIVQYAWVKLITSMGNAETLKPWLAQNGRNTSTGKLSELFFLANDRRHGATALAVAEVLYDREQTAKHREYLVSAYMRAGEYRQALPHLREIRGTSRANEDNYLATLTRLARGDSGYAKELSDYAIAQLDSNEVAAERKLQLVYMLINSGNKKLAMPYINQYAKSEGGQWRTLYNQVNAVATKSAPGKPSLVDMPRDYRVAMAADANTSDDTKRMLAFSLLDDGFRDDAVAIFAQLAANKGPESQEVKDLLYLWGPRLNEEQMAWISTRAAQSDGASAAKWGEYISYYGDDYAMMEYVSANPAALSVPAMRQKYFTAMATNGSVDSFDRGMAEWVNATNDPAALKDYAQVAQAYGFSDAAVRALKKIETLNPRDEVALKDLGVLTYSQSNYADSEKYLNQYMQTHSTEAQPQTTPFEALFFKGELARREKRADEATGYYQQVLRLGPQVANTVQRQSMYYSTQFHMGQHQNGKDGFYGLLTQYPADKSLLADFMSILIEYKYYDEATAVANQYDSSSPHYQGNAAAPLTIESPDVRNVESFNNGREMKINFNKPLPQGFSTQNGQKLSWVQEEQVGHDSVVIAAKEGYALRFTPTSSTSMAVIASAAPAHVTAQQRMQEQQDLRLQMLYARLELETGQEQQALNRLNTLNQHYPNDAQLMGYTANAENYTGNWSRALSLLDRAHGLTPHNQDIAMLKRDIEKLHSQHVMLDHEWRRIGNSDEQITTVGGMARVTNNFEIGGNFQNNELDASGVRRASDGRVGDYNHSQQRGEVYGAYYFDDGGRLQGSVFANNDTAGAGVYYAFNNPLGRTELLGEYHRPYWDFVEAVAEDATRDRVGLRHVTNLTNKTTVAGEVSYNRYNISLDEDVAQTALIRANIVHQLNSEGPYLAVGYGFDGEYVTDKQYRPLAGTGGDIYSPFPMNSREIHFPHAIVEENITDSTRVLAVGGYAFDRLGEHGPQAEVRLTQDLTDELEAQVRARYGLQTNDSDQNAMSVGGHLKYKF